MANSETKLIFERGGAGRKPCPIPPLDVKRRDIESMIPAKFLRKSPPGLPRVSEPEIVRHYMALSTKNFSIDTNFYPLGSCTMKYNPKINERCAALPQMANIHPYQPIETFQGLLRLMFELEGFLREIGGMDAVSLQPAAGAHGELTGLMVIRAYHRDRGDLPRNEVLIPDSAHGTNPASSSLCGMKCVQIKSNDRGCVDMEYFKKILSERTAAIMITNPNTLGLFEEQIEEITRLAHEKGALVYMDGANLNAIVGITRPGDFGIDILHFNLHKTFSTPHGGGGPGAGPIGVKSHLQDFLPIPRIVKNDGHYAFSSDHPRSIGKVRTFYGNVGILVRAYVYMLCHGAEGLRRNSENAVLNANYLLSRLSKHYLLKYNRRCMHEFVLSANRQRKKGVRALDIAKRLIDYGFHPPTIYFPLIVPEALMIEPTETENKETLDAFADAMLKIDEESNANPDLVCHAPYTRPIKRLDEVKAARQPVLRMRRPE